MSVSVVGVVVVAGGGATTVFAASVSLPFMPAAAWPGTVQREANLPFFVNLTVSLADLPGASTLVFLPAILKSWATLPLLTTVKITVPTLTLVFESLNLNSVIVTVTFVGAGVAAAALGLAAPGDGE